jgi:glucan 1,3-beta-glucosidase
MRFSLVAPLALAVAPSLVSAAGTLGFALGTKNADGSCKGQSDYEADFDAISAASGSTLVRGYSASDCNSSVAIMPAAKAKGFKVVLGIWCVTFLTHDSWIASANSTLAMQARRAGIL